MASRSQQEHRCTLREVDTSGLPPLPPNSSACTKFLRSIRKLTLLDMTSARSKNFFRNKSTMIAERKRHARGYCFVIHPFSKLNYIFQWIFAIVWTSSILFAFVYYLILFNYPFLIFQFLDIFRDLTIISFFITGYVDGKQKLICIDPKASALRYLKTYFIFDLIVTHLDEVLYFCVDWHSFKSTSNPAYFVFVVVVTLAYAVRIKSLMEAVHQIVAQLGGADWVYFLVSRILCIIFCLNAFTCLESSYADLIYKKNYPDKMWLVRVKVHDVTPESGRTMLDRYMESLLLVTTTFFGFAYSRCKITEVSDYILLMVIRMFGRFFTLYTLADFLRYFGLTGIAESKYAQYLAQLKEYICSKSLPNNLKSKILTYYEFKMQKNFFDEKVILGNLSESLKTELFLYGAKRLIDRTPPLKSLGNSVLAELFAHMTVETYLQNDVMYAPGDVVDSVFFVAYGTLIGYDKEGVEYTHFVDGDEFGVINMLTGKPAESLIVAAETSEIYKVPRSIMRQFMEQHAALTRYYEKRAAERYRRKAVYMEVARAGGSNVIAQLRERKILERRTLRERAVD